MSIQTIFQSAALIPTILLVSLLCSTGCDLGTYEQRADEVITPDEEESEEEGKEESEAEGAPSNPKPPEKAADPTA